MNTPSVERRAFTIIELIVVIAILLLLAVIVLAVYNGGGGDKMRSAARIGQSAILGARDRALHARERRGFRLTLDSQDANVATGFVYLQPLPKIQYGGASGMLAVCRQPETTLDYAGNDAIADDPRWLVLSGTEAQDLLSLDSQGLLPTAGFLRVRIPANGPIYTAFPVNGNAPFYVTMSGPLAVMQLTTPVVQSDNAFPAVQSLAFGGANASAEFDLGNEFLPNHAPIALPSGIVIDVARSSGVLTQYRDILFSPSGTVTGPLAALGPIHLLLRDIRDMTEGIDPADVTAAHREDMLLTIFPQTGNVRTFPVDLTDSDNDGVADDFTHFAKVGSAAGN